MSLAPLTPADIKEFRRSIDVSQVGLANALGCSRRTVEEWEKEGGNSPPSWLRYAFAAINSNLKPWGVE